VTNSYLPHSVGGVQLHIQTLADSLRPQHDVRVLARANTTEDEEYALREYEYRGLRIHTINNTFREAGHFFFLYADRGVDKAMEEVLDDFQPDLVHVHHLTCLSTNLATILRQRNIPAVMTLHDFWMICPRGQRLHRDGTFCETIDRKRCHGCIRPTWDFLFPEGEPDALTVRAEMEMLAAWDDRVHRVLTGFDRLIVPSRYFRETFSARGIESERIVAIPHGLEPAPFKHVAERRKPASKTRVGYLGTVIPSKGVHVLLEATDGLEDWIEVAIHGEAVPYHEDKDYLARLRASVPAGVEVHFHGRYLPDQIAAILEEVDILVVPSIWPEAFGLTLQEGFLAGIPVVAADIGALTEFVPEDRGLLFKPGDAGDLRRQLIRLLDDPDLARRIRGRAEWVRTPGEMAADTLAVYEDVLGKHRVPEETQDPFHEAFRSRVEAVLAIDGEALLEKAAAGLTGLAENLGLDSAPVGMLKVLGGYSWRIREDFQIQAGEVAWLRADRGTLLEERKLAAQAYEEQAWHLGREIEMLRGAREELLEERGRLLAALKDHEDQINTLNRVHQESVEYADKVSADLAVRDMVLRRLSRSFLVRCIARVRKIREFEDFKQ